MKADNGKVWETMTRVHRFEDPTGEITAAARAGAPIKELVQRYEREYKGVQEIRGNSALNAGLEYLIELVTGINSGAVKLDATHAVLGVGDSTNAVAVTQTQLEAERLGMNASWGVMDAGFPQREDRTMIFRSTFASSVAMFNWQEWGIAFLVSAGTRVLLNRKVDDIGTKPDYDVWIIEVGLRWA